MKTDVIRVKNSGEGMAEALSQAEAVSVYKSLPKKEAIHLRLLTEEMLGMFRTLTGKSEADFFIEDTDKAFELHLSAETKMTGDKRKKLLSVSSTGENAAAKGIMGKLRDVFAKAIEPDDDSVPSYFMGGWMVPNLGSSSMPAMGEVGAELWSLNQYKLSLQGKTENKEEWDELEKSIVASIADEVRIYIRGGNTEMVIYKKFE